MRHNPSPFRYPGGKAGITNMMIDILRTNGLERRPYVEPFAGGAGLALTLLFDGHVSEIHLNDVDPAIWSFWHATVSETGRLCDLVESTPITVEEWRKQKDIYSIKDLTDPVRLGFSAFFLNRTNRSGIIKGAWVIGGLGQTGNYKIDCRFNRSNLRAKIERVASYRDAIRFYRLDAREFLQVADQTVPAQSLFCIDPPYFKKGAKLYTNFYAPDDHRALRDRIVRLERPWLVTYDDVPEINDLYKHHDRHLFNVNYSVQTKRVADELLVTSPGMIVPPSAQTRAIA